MGVLHRGVMGVPEGLTRTLSLAIWRLPVSGKVFRWYIPLERD